MKIKLIALLTLCMSLTGCANGTAATFLAGMGIGGAALNVYCASGGSGCSAGLVAYANLITTQANDDAAIIESGSATVVKIQGVVSNLQALLSQGNALPGLTAKQQAEVSAITGAASEVITLLMPLIVGSPAQPSALAAGAPTILTPSSLPITWKLSANDHAALAKMRTKVAAVTH